MTFAISNYKMASSQEVSNEVLKKTHRYTLIVDVLVFGSVAVISGLILSGIINTGLPMNVGTLGHSLVLGGIGLFSLFALADVVTFLKLQKKEKVIEDIERPKKEAWESIELKKKAYREAILSADDVLSTYDYQLENEALYTESHKIFENLYLGNAYEFGKASYLANINDELGYSLGTSNPKKFQTIITMCPLEAMHDNCVGLAKYKSGDVRASLNKQGITWHYLGRNLADVAEKGCWKDLVTSCTFWNEYGTLTDDVKEWFKLTFEELDKALYNGVKTLVHCQAGMSRSPTVLAAYLINRFQVTTSQAINFLKSKRYCVDPKFTVFLQDYARALGVKY